MKELTIEEKAKCYDKAIERAKAYQGLRSEMEIIFPELKESEDEKTKRLLHTIANKMSQHLRDIFTEEEFQCFDAWSNAWLEKQCVQKQELLTKENALKNSPFVEQKPADKKGMNLVEEEMTPFQKKVFCIIDTAIEEEQGLKQVCDELLALAKHEIEQKSAWSVEDEVGLGDAMWAIKQAKTIAKDENDMGNLWYAERWLKSLKDRVQPKQEWSEEDKKRMNHIIQFLEDKDRWKDNERAFPIEEDVRWLKSLRPQSTWKPSEEEMKALAEALSLANNCGEESAFDLRTLYKQLKKLNG